MLKIISKKDIKVFRKRRKAVQNWYKERGYRSILEAEADGHYQTMLKIFNNA